MKLTKSQNEAMDLLLKGQNVFLTGEAGTGKSFLLNQFVTKQKPTTKKKKTTGRKRKYNGLETKVMRLPSQFEGLFNALSDKLSDKKHTKKEIEEITKSLVSSIK